MAESDSSVVSIVAIIAILILAGIAIYFFLIAGGGNDADIQIDFGTRMSLEAPPEVALHTGPEGLVVRW